MNQLPGWVESLHVSQRKRLGFGFRIPDESTFRRILRTVDTGKLNRALQPWFEEAALTGKTIALDGKRLCGAHKYDEKPPELLNIVEHETGNILGQETITSPGNERAAAVKWLSNTSLFRCIITGDALHTTKEMAEIITGKCNSDYLFVVKANNKMLFEVMQALKMNESRGEPHASTFERGHGREETREIWCSKSLGWHGKASSFFPGAKQIATVQRTQKNLSTGKATVEIAHLVTSKSRIEMSPAEMLKLNRTHWSVEAKIHYVKDGFMSEDKSRCRAGNLAHNLSILRNVALKILRKIQLTMCTRIGRATIPQAHRTLQKAGGVCKLLNC